MHSPFNDTFTLLFCGQFVFQVTLHLFHCVLGLPFLFFCVFKNLSSKKKCLFVC